MVTGMNRTPLFGWRLRERPHPLNSRTKLPYLTRMRGKPRDARRQRCRTLDEDIAPGRASRPRTAWRRRSCAPTSPACRSSGSTTARRPGSTTRNRWPTPAARSLYRLYGGVNARTGLRTDGRGELDRGDGRPHRQSRATRATTTCRRSTTRRCSGATRTCACTAASASPAGELSRDHMRPVQPGRARRLDQRGHGLPSLQQLQGLAHAGAGEACS